MNTMRYFFILLLCLLMAVPAFAQDATPIELGGSVSGELSEDQAEALYTFDGEQGQGVTITLVSDDFDAYLRLQDEAGNDIETDDDSAGRFNARIGPVVLPRNGTYTIIATSLSGLDSGSYTLTIEHSDTGKAEGGALEYGQTVEGELTNDALFHEYTFVGAAGDTVTITQTSSDFDSYLRLTDADGTTLMTDDDSAGSLNSRIGPYTLPEAGAYTITANSLSSSSTGRYRLSLNLVDAIQLGFDETVEVSMLEDGVYLLFDAEAGQAVNIEVDSGDRIDTVMTLRGPNGYEVARSDDSRGTVDPAIYNQLLGESGTYTVVIAPYSAFVSGEVTVTLAEAELGSLDDGPQVLEFNNSQDSGAVIFNGVAKQAVRLTFEIETDSDYTSPSVTVKQANSSLVYSSLSNVQAFSFVTVIPHDGMVTVEVMDYSYDGSSITVSMEVVE